MSALEVRVKRARDVYGAAFGLVAYCSAQHGACTRRTRTPMLSVKCTLVVRIAYVYPWEKYWFIWTLEDAFAYNVGLPMRRSYSQCVYYPYSQCIYSEYYLRSRIKVPPKVVSLLRRFLIALSLCYNCNASSSDASLQRANKRDNEDTSMSVRW